MNIRVESNLTQKRGRRSTTATTWPQLHVTWLKSDLETIMFMPNLHQVHCNNPTSARNKVSTQMYPRLHFGSVASQPNRVLNQKSANEHSRWISMSNKCNQNYWQHTVHRDPIMSSSLGFKPCFQCTTLSHTDWFARPLRREADRVLSPLARVALSSWSVDFTFTVYSKETKKILDQFKIAHLYPEMFTQNTGGVSKPWLVLSYCPRC